jgi:hypothetical protein
MWQTPLIHGRVHFSRLVTAKKAEASLVATKLIPLHSYMPQFIDMARPPAYLMNRSTASDSAVSTPTAVTAAPAGKKFTPPTKKVNFGALNTQDSADQSPVTSFSASTITAADDWAPYDDTAVREVVNDPSNEKLIAQLTALVAATTIGQPNTPSTPSRGDRRPAYGDGRDTRQQPPESTMDKACYSFFVNGTCPRDSDCRYSHDDKIINEARLACMAKWRACDVTCGTEFECELLWIVMGPCMCEKR